MNFNKNMQFFKKNFLKKCKRGHFALWSDSVFKFDHGKIIQQKNSMKQIAPHWYLTEIGVMIKVMDDMI